MNPKYRRIFEWAALVLLVAVLTITLFVSVRDFHLMRLRGEMGLRNRHNQSLPAPEQIQGWMTFRYINLVFNLPPDYLKASLKISDPSYPSLTLNSWAKKSRISPQQLTQAVIKAINNR